MAKKSFDISSTLSKNKDAQLAPKVPLKKKTKDLKEVEEKVAIIHQEEPPTPAKVEKAKQPLKAKPAVGKAKVKAKAEKMVRLTIDTPSAMHRKLKIRSIERGVSMRDYILQLLEKELGGK